MSAVFRVFQVLSEGPRVITPQLSIKRWYARHTSSDYRSRHPLLVNGNSCTVSSLTAGRYAVVLLVSAYRPGSAGTSIRSSVVATCQATCAQLLVVLGTVHAEAAGQALGSMLEACFNPEATNPPEGLTEHIAEGLCKVAAGSGCASH